MARRSRAAPFDLPADRMRILGDLPMEITTSDGRITGHRPACGSISGTAAVSMGNHMDVLSPSIHAPCSPHPAFASRREHQSRSAAVAASATLCPLQSRRVRRAREYQKRYIKSVTNFLSKYRHRKQKSKQTIDCHTRNRDQVMQKSVTSFEQLKAAEPNRNQLKSTRKAD